MQMQFLLPSLNEARDIKTLYPHSPLPPLPNRREKKKRKKKSNL